MRGFSCLFNFPRYLSYEIKMRNIEIKARVRNIDSLIKIAKQLSFSEGQEILQHDTFYNSKIGRLKLRKFKDDFSELIYYDRPDGEGPKLSTYEKCSIPCSSTENLNTILQTVLGAKEVVKKRRLLFMVGQTRVHVDAVEDLGNFMELEVVLNEDQSLEEGEIIAHELMTKLGIGKSDLLAGAYADMLKK